MENTGNFGAANQTTRMLNFWTSSVTEWAAASSDCMNSSTRNLARKNQLCLAMGKGLLAERWGWSVDWATFASERGGKGAKKKSANGLPKFESMYECRRRYEAANVRENWTLQTNPNVVDEVGDEDWEINVSVWLEDTDGEEVRRGPVQGPIPPPPLQIRPMYRRRQRPHRMLDNAEPQGTTTNDGYGGEGRRDIVETESEGQSGCSAKCCRGKSPEVEVRNDTECEKIARKRKSIGWDLLPFLFQRRCRLALERSCRAVHRFRSKTCVHKHTHRSSDHCAGSGGSKVADHGAAVPNEVVRSRHSSE